MCDIDVFDVNFYTSKECRYLPFKTKCAHAFTCAHLSDGHFKHHENGNKVILKYN